MPIIRELLIVNAPCSFIIFREPINVRIVAYNGQFIGCGVKIGLLWQPIAGKNIFVEI